MELIGYFALGSIAIVVWFYIQSLRESLAQAEFDLFRAQNSVRDWQLRFDRHLRHSKVIIEDIRNRCEKKMSERKFQLYTVKDRTNLKNGSFMVVVPYDLHAPILTLEAYYPSDRFSHSPLGDHYSYWLAAPAFVLPFEEARPC